MKKNRKQRPDPNALSKVRGRGGTRMAESEEGMALDNHQHFQGTDLRVLLQVRDTVGKRQL